MLKVKELFQPNSIENAYQVLAQNKNYKIVSGATSFVFVKDAEYEGLVDITRLDLKYIKKENNKIKIGSLVTINELAESKELENIGNGIFKKVTITLSNYLTRNLCTVGGNIAKPFWWSDLPGLFLLLDANLKIYRDSKEIFVKLSDIYSKKEKLSNSDIVLEVSFEIPNEKDIFKYDTVLKTKTDFAITSIYMRYKVEANKIQDIKIYTSAVEALPKRLEKVEQSLKSIEITEENINNAVENLDELKPINDFRASNEYKITLVKELIKRNLLD